MSKIDWNAGSGLPDTAPQLKRLVNLIDAAGLHNLSSGVQLGQLSWHAKAYDAMQNARAALKKYEKHERRVNGEQ